MYNVITVSPVKEQIPVVNIDSSSTSRETVFITSHVANDITSAPQTDECRKKTLIELTINNKTVLVDNGASVAAAILAVGADQFRRSVTGEPRFPVCGMGICFECRVTIDGTPHQRSCQTLAENGMIVQTDE